MAEIWVQWGVFFCAVSGLPGLFMNAGSNAGQRAANALLWLGALLGLTGAAIAFANPSTAVYAPFGPDTWWKIRVDALSAFFLLPVFLIPSLCSLYGLAYWPQLKHAENGQRLRFLFGMVPAGMALVTVAVNAILFLAAWEVMTLASFMLVATEDEKPEVREAGWHYLVATHVGVLALIALFALLRNLTGTFDLGPLQAGSISGGAMTALFFLALVGFGLKAGLMPMHVWLPGAHANAPSHVSAIMSGVLLKMGVYGLVRFLGYAPAPPVWWGEVLLGLGVASAVLGVLFALGQHDIKRLLAYHSIENIGIIAIGLALALLGRSLGRPAWVVLGLAGSLLHVLNHGLFKSLLFLGAGSVIHATGTREIDRLGGLARRMPRTAGAFLVGAVAICGLPPLNGFVSEFLVYLGLFRAVLKAEGTAWAGPAMAAPALALVGALAVACFVKVYGVVFLGEPRSEAARKAKEAGFEMIAPMMVLAALCAAIGLLPFMMAPALDGMVKVWAPDMATEPVFGLAPLGWVGISGGALLLTTLAVALWVRSKSLRFPPDSAVTWDCGYAAPSARMQYTASSFAQMLMEYFRWLLWPRKRSPQIYEYFPSPSSFHSDVPDIVLDRFLIASWNWIERTAGKFRIFQQGILQVYVLYILATVCALLLWW